jgi:MYXO-CTERM domain-containing protein
MDLAVISRRTRDAPGYRRGAGRGVVRGGVIATLPSVVSRAAVRPDRELGKHARMRIPGLVLATCALASPALAGPTQAPIIGGTNTTVGQFPNVVALQVGGGLCTGTLLTKDWVLTAAHCIDPNVVGQSEAQITSGLRIHFDTVNIFQSQGTVVRASQIFKHPGFDLNNLGMHDIGLVRLATPVTDRAPARVNFDPAKAPVGIAVTMVGYGVTSRSNPNSAGTQRVVDQTSVSCAVGGGSDADLLCFSQVAGKGKCVGDSGGPSFATIDGQQWQVGVTSFGDQNCQQFGADTRTDAEEAFVLEHVPELNPCDADNPCAEGRTCFQGTCIADPFSPGGIGSECADGPECESGQCASSSEESLCTFACATGTDGACPDGFECRDTSGGAGGVCWPTDEGGCCSTGNGGVPTSLIGVAAVGLFLRRRRRR